MSARFAFEPAPPTVLGIAGSDELFPVRRVYCVGLNYAEHVQEMGFGRTPPIFFAKPTDSVVYVPEGETYRMPYPAQTKDYQFEIELVVAIGKGGSEIPAARAAEHIFGYAVGLDMTRRDLQAEARKGGLPWETSKSFDLSAPVGPIHRLPAVPSEGAIWLDVDGVRKQSSDLKKLIWNICETIEHLSRYFALQAGDLIFSGTPEGVGPVQRGELMVSRVSPIPELRVLVC
jgi:fumarylpyruvate hydrolase